MAGRKTNTARRLSIAPAGLVVLSVLASAGCDDAKPGASGGNDPRAGPPVIFTTFYPTRYFAERIGGDAVRVVCPVPDDADPIFWTPDAETIGRYQSADLIVLNGAGFEKWVERATLPRARTVDTARSFEKEFMRYEQGVTHSHGPAGEHAHEGLDGHTWVDPLNAVLQARAIRDGLVERFPEHAEGFRERFSALERDLRELDAALRAVSNGQTPILCSHPAYNYIARRYGWRIRNLDLDPETVPPAETLDGIRELLREFPARVILWESKPAAEVARSIETALGLRNVVFSPCELLAAERIASGEDYLSVMRANIDALRPVFGAGGETEESRP